MYRLNVLCITALCLMLTSCSFIFESAQKTPADTENQGSAPVSSVSVEPKPGVEESVMRARERSREQAKLVFIRSSLVASAINVSLYDVTTGEPQIIGEIANDSQRHHFLTPGDYVFMIVADESLDYMVVNALPDRTYYSIIKPRMGMWKPSFSLVPVKTSNQDEWDGEVSFNGEKYTNIIVEEKLPLEPNIQRGEHLAPEVLAKHQVLWLEWQEKSPEELLSKTLENNDGR